MVVISKTPPTEEIEDKVKSTQVTKSTNLKLFRKHNGDDNRVCIYYSSGNHVSFCWIKIVYSAKSDKSALRKLTDNHNHQYINWAGGNSM